MKNAKISRRSFLLGLAACSAAGILTACKGMTPPPAALPPRRKHPLPR
ncbi:MAG: twin-arginine translocation signal domain-containing protein [Ruminococcus callidus]